MGDVGVRKADLTDMGWMLGQLKEFAKFFGTKKSIYRNDAFVQQIITTVIQHHIMLVAEKKNVGLVGLIGGYLIPHHFNPDIRVLSEAFWWVDEKYRGGRAALMLLNEFQKFGEKNADWISFTLEAHSPVNERALIKRGFHLHEKQYLLENS